MNSNNKNYIIYFNIKNNKLYVSNIHMRCLEEKEIHLTDNITHAKHFDKYTAENISIMNWWKYIGEMLIEEI